MEFKKKKKGNNNKIASSWVQRIYWPLQEEGSGTVGEMLFLLMFKEIKSFISLGIKKKKSSLLPVKKKRKSIYRAQNARTKANLCSWTGASMTGL